VLVEYLAQALPGRLDGSGQGQPSGLAVPLVAHVSVFQATFVKRLGAGGTLGAQPAEIARMVRVTRDPGHSIIGHFHDDPAADTAIGTDALYACVCHELFLHQTKKGASSLSGKRKRHGAFVVNEAIISPIAMQGLCKGQASLSGPSARGLPDGIAAGQGQPGKGQGTPGRMPRKARWLCAIGAAPVKMHCFGGDRYLACLPSLLPGPRMAGH
jgi:hypothetical protein